MTFVPARTLEEVLAVALPDVGRRRAGDAARRRRRAAPRLRGRRRLTRSAGVVAFYISRPRLRPRVAPDRDHQRARPRGRPDVGIVVRTSAPRWLFDRTVARAVQLVDGPCDTGIVQIDSLRLDEAATIARRATFYATLRRARRARSARCCASTTSRSSIADAPPLACAAAARAGIPSVVVSNFTWDWIYEGYARALRRDAPDALADDPAGLRAGRRGLAAADARRLRDVRRRSSTCRSSRATRRHDRRRDVLSALGLPPTGRSRCLVRRLRRRATSILRRSTASTTWTSSSPAATRRRRCRPASRSSTSARSTTRACATRTWSPPSTSS